MARKRMIDPQIWVNEDFSKLSFLSRLIWIGLISNADDEGRGKANISYLKSQLFPYDEDLSLKKIENSIKEIEKFMSIEFYSVNDKKYYQLLSWKRFQNINRPSQSQIPEKMGNFEKKISECSVNNHEQISESSVNNHEQITDNSVPKIEIEIEDNKKERVKKEKAPRIFVAPTLDEVRNYAEARCSAVDPVKFFEFYSAGNWVDGKGQPVRNWKQKFLTWENKEPAALKLAGRAYTKDEFHSMIQSIDEIEL